MRQLVLAGRAFASLGSSRDRSFAGMLGPQDDLFQEESIRTCLTYDWRGIDFRSQPRSLVKQHTHPFFQLCA